MWEGKRWALDEIDRLAGAKESGALLDALDQELGRLFAAPHKRQAPLLTGPELDDAAPTGRATRRCAS